MSKFTPEALHCIMKTMILISQNATALNPLSLSVFHAITISSVPLTACPAFPVISFSNLLIPISLSLHSVPSTHLLGLDLIPKLMLIKSLGFSVLPCVALKTLDLWSRFTQSPPVNGEYLVIVLLYLLYVACFVVSFRHLPMGHCIGLLPETLMLTKVVLFWFSIWGTRCSAKYCCPKLY